MSRSFVHLHNHSEYSLLDGSCRLSELVETAREFGQPAVAITDHGNLFAALKFYRQAKAAGVKPIIGVEAYMAVGSRLTRGGGGGGGRRKPYHHMILLARDYTGYRNLLKLVSRGYTEGFYYKPRIDREILAEHAEGLIGTSGCLGGEIPQLLLAGRKEEAEGTIRAYQEILGAENFFLELQDQGIPEEHAILPDLRTLSRRTGAPLLATNDCHYMRAADHFAHDVLICIQTGKTIDDPRALRFTDQHYFKNTDEMWERFRDIPEALENTLLVAERCNLDIPDRGYQLPHFQVPGEVSPEDYFRRVVQEGYEARGPRWARWRAAGELKHSEEEYRERLQREMDTIIEMGFPGYFLIVWDLIRHARQEGIPVGPGRGSAAGSLVAYCLAITDLDPLRYDLLFERFLNPERVSMPDIDIDFCVKGRGRVIDYVTEKYGRENVAQIITFGTMAARAVIRDVGRGLNIPYAKVDRIAKLVPAELDATIDSSLKSVPELQEACGDPDVKRLLEVARRLEGLARHASTHAAGVVIAPAPITDFSPLYQVKEGERTTQFSMGDLESIGLLKMDFLGLKTLTLIDDVVKRVSARLGQEIDFDSIGIDDSRTYELFARGATSGLFQFESDGMKDILRKLKPERFEDLIALNALYRPGPLKGGLVDDFIKRRHGQVQVEYIVPELRPILEETYGVMVYQEQVMKIASELGGFSLGDADLLRRAMGKKNIDLLAAQKKTFLKGTQERGLPPQKGEKIFAQMEHFAGYGFNKSHSAAYALVAYQTGYLKAHFPLDFMASLLTAERNNTDKLVSYLGECRDMGLEILPPDITLSQADFSAEEQSIRFGLSAIKNAGEGAVEAVLAARQRLGTIRSLQELVMEVEQRAVNRRVFEAFIKSGCLDSIYPVRARLMAGLDRIQDMAHKARQDQESGQGSLFVVGEGEERPAIDDGLPEVEPWTDHETLAYEKESLGFYMSGHPLREYAREVADFGTHNSADMRHVRSGEAVAIAGMISAIRKRKTRKGDWMAVLTLEDLEGICEVVLFPDLTASSNEILVEDAAILVTGRAESQGGEDRGKILAEEILPLAQVRHKRARAVAISLEAPGLDESRLQSLRRVLESHKGGVPVVFVLTQPSSFRAEVKPSPELKVSPGDELTQAVEAVLGPGVLKLRIRA